MLYIFIGDVADGILIVTYHLRYKSNFIHRFSKQRRECDPVCWAITHSSYKKHKLLLYSLELMYYAALTSLVLPKLVFNYNILEEQIFYRFAQYIRLINLVASPVIFQIYRIF